MSAPRFSRFDDGAVGKDGLFIPHPSALIVSEMSDEARCIARTDMSDEAHLIAHTEMSAEAYLIAHTERSKTFES